jgi:hypothetical protein
LWTLLPHRGNSSTPCRIALITRFVRLFGKDVILGVLGDREFIGQAWFGYLNNAGIPFYFRIRKDADTHNARGLSVPARDADKRGQPMYASSSVAYDTHEAVSCAEQEVLRSSPTLETKAIVFGSRAAGQKEMLNAKCQLEQTSKDRH